ncbi:hypothetical protein [Georgenia deserti]|uniref:DUF2867 domain-containing protein n=1 Tax=Georgenia deserti TaxID=2093781 RepID=A0ABW4L6M8_9MICO
MSRVSAAVGVDDVPATTLALTPVANPGYADEFTLDLPGAASATAEAWARAMFGDTPDAAERFIFRTLLRLRLAPGPSRDTVAGFVITDRAPESIRLMAHSPLLTTHLVIQVSVDGASLATVMDYHRRRGRVTWTVVSLVHRRLAPGLLREAARTVLGQ